MPATQELKLLLVQVMQQMGKAKMSHRRTELTLQEIKDLPTEVAVYKQVGKAYVSMWHVPSVRWHCSSSTSCCQANAVATCNGVCRLRLGPTAAGSCMCGLYRVLWYLWVPAPKTLPPKPPSLPCVQCLCVTGT